MQFLARVVSRNGVSSEGVAVRAGLLTDRLQSPLWLQLKRKVDALAVSAFAWRTMETLAVRL